MPQKPRYNVIRSRSATKFVDKAIFVNGHNLSLHSFGNMANDNGLVQLTRQMGQSFKGGHPVDPELLNTCMDVIIPCEAGIIGYFISNHPEKPEGANAFFIDYDNPLPDFSRREPTFHTTGIFPIEFYRI